MSKTPGPNSAIQSEKELFIATSVLKRRITATFSKQVRLLQGYRKIKCPWANNMISMPMYYKNYVHSPVIVV